MPVLEHVESIERGRLTPQHATRNSPPSLETFHEHIRRLRARKEWSLLSKRMWRRGCDNDVPAYDEMDEELEAEALHNLSMKALADEWDDDAI